MSGVCAFLTQFLWILERGRASWRRISLPIGCKAAMHVAAHMVHAWSAYGAANAVTILCLIC